eukprot:8231249-Pyramimonas_sp.AAC.1
MDIALLLLDVDRAPDLGILSLPRLEAFDLGRTCVLSGGLIRPAKPGGRSCHRPQLLWVSTVANRLWRRQSDETLPEAES